MNAEHIRSFQEDTRAKGLCGEPEPGVPTLGVCQKYARHVGQHQDGDRYWGEIRRCPYCGQEMP